MKQINGKNIANNILFARARAGFSFLRAYTRLGLRYSTGLLFLIVMVLITSLVFAESETSFFIKQLKNPNAFLRKSAAAKLGVSKDPKAINPLIQALNDKDHEVRGQAADSLGLLRAETSVARLANLVQKDPSTSVRKRASLALANIPGPVVDQHLISCLKNKNKKIVQGCVRMLGQRRVSQAQKPLQKLLAGSRGSLKSTVLDALGQIGFTGSIEDISKNLTAADFTIRLAAIRALGTTGQPSAIEKLRPYLKNLNPGFRSAAAWSLVRLGYKPAGPFSRDLLFHPSPVIRRECAEALGFLKQTKNKKQLAKAFKREKDPVVKTTLKFALEGLR